MKKYPNTSIFNLITQKEGNTEKLIFIYIKPVSDFYTSENIHWYPPAAARILSGGLI